MKESDRNSRKRGDVLTESIYEATEQLIKEVGYVNLTFQQIAQAAKTSRTVLYRRWATTFDLIDDLMKDRWTMTLDGDLIDKIVDTGSLRGDLLLLLRLYQRVYIEVGPSIMNAILFELSQNNERVDKVKIKAEGKNIRVMKKILELAQIRGEKVKEVSDMTLTLPFGLIRMRYILGGDEITEEQLEQIVDEVLLPVFKAE